MIDTSNKILLNGIRALGGDYDYTPSTDTASLLIDPVLSSMLGVPEFVTVNFSNDPSVSNVTLSDLQSNINRIAIQKGSAVSIRFEPDPGVVWPSQKKAELSLSSVNGKVVFTESRIMDQSYVIVYCRNSVVSDEKRLMLTSTAVNCSFLSIASELCSGLENNIEKLTASTSPAVIPSFIPEKLTRTLNSALQYKTQESLVDFYQSIDKRLKRDASRLHGYYNELYETARKPSGRKKIEHEVIKANLDAITAEYGKKIDDLRIKYITSITMEPICVLWVTMPCMVSWFDIYMGNRKIQKSIIWNPISASNDTTICDCCDRPVTVSHVCRNLHWLCDCCWKKCPKCGREYCALCKPDGCSCKE